MSSVLVGITSKNRKQFLSKAVSSALMQEGITCKVAVYDDASTDSTADLIDEYPTVQWNMSKIEKGYLYARNLFLSTTDCDYFCSLDDDSWFLDTDALSKALAYMNDNPLVAALAFRILTPESNDGELYNKIETEATLSNNFIGCGHLLRVSSAKKIHYFTPNPGYYGGEEKDMCIRLMDSGFSIMYFPSVSVWHEKTSLARNQPKQHRSGVCNDLVFNSRRLPFLLVMPVMLYKLFSHLRFSLFYKKGFLFKACLLGIRDYFYFLTRKEIKRAPVRFNTYKRFISLNAAL